MKELIDAAVFRDIILCASAALEQNRQLINELNVFPVPDGDTGTNMSLTMGAAATELKKRDFPTLTAAADCAASAMLRGARGNSGVILSLLFRGLAKKLKGCEVADAKTYAAAMTAGVDAAYKAVMKPAEGTILTVSRVSTSSAVEFAEHGGDLELMFSCAIESAQEALADTVNLNPVLKRAGVVDAGGKGYVFILEATLAVLRGEAYVPDEAAGDEAPVEVKEKADFNDFSTGEIAYAYCTEFICGRDNPKDPDELRSFLMTLGDCVVVVDDDEIIKVHVHTNVPGKVLTEALTYGPLLKVKIENMREQHSEMAGGEAPAADAAPAEPEIAPAEKPYGAVAVCAGTGMAELFRELGVDNIVTGGQTMNPSTEDILRAVNRTPAETVFVFPNNKNIHMAAEQCIPLTEKQVVVIPTKTVPQGISAMLMMDDSASVDELREAMLEASSGVHTALVTYAARDSEYDGFQIHAGEYLALMDGALLGSYTDLNALFDALCVSAGEYSPAVISVYYGEDVKEEDASVLGGKLSESFPDAELSVVNGGQPVYYYMVSIE
ncbi:MAG TPA: DAK2 domain-containing protein [Candidatus Scatomorpha merdigallinarum]|nr:DAK2 domain-containing protein [Candidatus Scatomorpha merdigallinarum]